MKQNELIEPLIAFRSTKHLLLIVFGLGNVSEYVRKRIRNDSFRLRRIGIAGHGVRFAGAGLTVRQYGPIVTFQHFVEDRPCGIHV